MQKINKKKQPNRVFLSYWFITTSNYVSINLIKFTIRQIKEKYIKMSVEEIRESFIINDKIV